MFIQFANNRIRRIRNRTINHSGCPYCAGRKAIKGINDISTLYPDLVAEWDYEKNENLKPYELQLIASTLVVISGIIALYVVSLSNTETIADVENPVI